MSCSWRRSRVCLWRRAVAQQGQVSRPSAHAAEGRTGCDSDHGSEPNHRAARALSSCRGGHDMTKTSTRFASTLAAVALLGGWRHRPPTSRSRRARSPGARWWSRARRAASGAALRWPWAHEGANVVLAARRPEPLGDRRRRHPRLWRSGAGRAHRCQPLGGGWAHLADAARGPLRARRRVDQRRRRVIALGRFDETPLADHERVIDVNLKGRGVRQL